MVSRLKKLQPELLAQLKDVVRGHREELERKSKEEQQAFDAFVAAYGELDSLHVKLNAICDKYDVDARLVGNAVVTWAMQSMKQADVSDEEIITSALNVILSVTGCECVLTEVRFNNECNNEDCDCRRNASDSGSLN